MLANRRVCRSLLIPPLMAALAASAPACALPEGDPAAPEGAWYDLAHARVAGGSDPLWERLHPEVQGAFARWHAAEKATVALIENTPYESPADAARALAALADGRRAAYADAKALFAAFIGPADPAALDRMEVVGARVRAATVEGDAATVRTWGGDAIRLAKGADGAWKAHLPEPAWKAVQDAAAQAEANLETQKANHARLTKAAAAAGERATKAAATKAAATKAAATKAAAAKATRPTPSPEPVEPDAGARGPEAPTPP